MKADSFQPNDEHAKEILDFAHHMYLLTLDHKLHLAPLKNPQVYLPYKLNASLAVLTLSARQF